jgi:hypothetical protein
MVQLNGSGNRSMCPAREVRRDLRDMPAPWRQFRAAFERPPLPGKFRIIAPLEKMPPPLN